MWGWAAALEDNRERREPFPRTGGKKPSRPEQRATSGRFFSSAVSPAEQVVSGERGGSDAASRAPRGCPLKTGRGRLAPRIPRFAHHPDASASRQRSRMSRHGAATDSIPPPCGEVRRRSCDAGVGDSQKATPRVPQERAPTPTPLAASDLPTRGGMKKDMRTCSVLYPCSRVAKERPRFSRLCGR